MQKYIHNCTLRQVKERYYSINMSIEDIRVFLRILNGHKFNGTVFLPNFEENLLGGELAIFSLPDQSPREDNQVKRWVAPALHISRRKWSFLRHVRKFVKEGYFLYPGTK